MRLAAEIGGPETRLVVQTVVQVEGCGAFEAQAVVTAEQDGNDCRQFICRNSGTVDQALR